MKSLLTSALFLAFLAAPVIAEDDAPSCPSCPKKGDKMEPSSLVMGCECASCSCKDCKGDCCGKKKDAAPAQDDCDKGCDKDKKKDCGKDDCSDVTGCDTCDKHKDGDKPAAPAQDDCDKGCDKGKKKDCGKDDCSASQEDCGGCKKGKKKGGCDKEEAPASA